MRVNYTPSPGGSYPWVPVLTVRLRGPDGVCSVPMLVDSGASDTTVPERLLRRLGVEFTGETCTLTAFNDTRVTGRVGQVEILVGDTRYASRVVAIPDDVRAVAVLGHRDFFTNFYVGFDSQSRSFYVSQPRRR